jgi:hypothetical protein
MFKVKIALEVVAQSDSLAEACRLFILKTKELIKKEGGISEYILFESCMITAVIDGREGMMNFFAISAFSHSIGVLKEDGTLSNKPVPYIPKDIVKQVFIASSNNSLEVYVREHEEMLSQLMLEPPLTEKQEASQESIIIT